MRRNVFKAEITRSLLNMLVKYRILLLASIAAHTQMRAEMLISNFIHLAMILKFQLNENAIFFFSFCFVA